VARSPESVEVFATTAPTRPHVDVSFFEADERSNHARNTGEFIAKLREAAAARGCDALVLNSVSNVLELQGRYSDNNKDVAATCIVYTAQ
jgi:hypothetical protein